MTALQDVSKLQFRVETLVVRDGRKLRRIRPDADGYYKGLPVAVLGIVTRNRTYYDVETFSDQFTNPNSMFRERLQGGQLPGEYGHPNLLGMSNDMAINRLSILDEKLISHNFRAIYTGSKLEGGGELLLSDLRPTGPYGKDLKDSLDDPSMNTAFSLRAITEATDRNGVSYRYTRKLITFDAVTGGGYFEASKLFAETAGTESLSTVDVQIPNDFSPVRFTQCSIENYSNAELNELFGAKRVMLLKQTVSLVTPLERRKDFLTGKNLRSIYHEQIKE